MDFYLCVRRRQRPAILRPTERNAIDRGQPCATGSRYRFGGVALDTDRVRPVIGTQASLLLQPREELTRLGQLLPHRGQKGAARVALAEDQPVDAGTQLAEQLFL